MTAKILLTCDGPPRTTGRTCRAYLPIPIPPLWVRARSAAVRYARAHGWVVDVESLASRCPSCMRDHR